MAEPENSVKAMADPPAFRGQGVEVGYLSVSLVVALVALFAVAWLWVDSRQREAALQLGLGKRLEQFEVRGREIDAQVKHEQNTLREAQVRLELLERKLAESQSRQLELTEMYRAMANSRDEWALTDIEQFLTIASQQLQWAGDVKGALTSLQMADVRLQRMNDPQLFSLRRAILRDIEKLQTLPVLDLSGINLHLETLMAEVDQWALLPGRGVQHAPIQRLRAEDSRPWWQRLGSEVWRDMQQLIRIQNLQKAELPLLPPEQAYFLRENIRLRLLSAKIALLQRNDASFKADLQAVSAWVERYFDLQHPKVRKALERVKKLGQTRLTPELPDVSGSLGALQAIRLGRERGK